MPKFLAAEWQNKASQAVGSHLSMIQEMRLKTTLIRTDTQASLLTRAQTLNSKILLNQLKPIKVCRFQIFRPRVRPLLRQMKLRVDKYMRQRFEMLSIIACFLKRYPNLYTLMWLPDRRTIGLLISEKLEMQLHMSQSLNMMTHKTNRMCVYWSFRENWISQLKSWII